MGPGKAAEHLEVIRTLMERTTQYQLLTARTGLAAGSFAMVGALAFLFLDAADPWQFGLVWGAVFAASVLATGIGTVLRGRAIGERVWSRPARAVVAALSPSLFAALALTIFCFALGRHLWLPGLWMLCYGQGALATAAYAPTPIRFLGLFVLVMGAVALGLGPTWAIPLMALVFGIGHLGLGVAMLRLERQRLRLYRSVA
jgi:hypothetical protein